MIAPALALVAASLLAPQPAARTDCTVNIAAQTVRCAEAGWRPRRADESPRDQDLIRIVPQGVTRDAGAGTLSVHLAGRNLRDFAIGTPDGVTRTGLKVYLESGPSVTRPRGLRHTVLTLENADGVIDVRRAGQQAYIFYDAALAPDETTTAAPWTWSVPPGVRSFSFSVRVVAANAGPENVAGDAPRQSRLRTAWIPCTYGDLCVPDVLRIRFRPGATADERQAAIEYRRATLLSQHGDMIEVHVPAGGSFKRLLEYEFAFRLLSEVAEANHIRHMGVQLPNSGC